MRQRNQPKEWHEYPWRKGHWFYLFHSLLILLILYPYLEHPGEATKPWFLDVLNSMIVLCIIYAASWNPKEFIGSLVIGIPALLSYWISYLLGHPEVAMFFPPLLFLYAIVMIFIHLFRSHVIGSEEIYGATSMYILVGLTWAYFYQWIEWFLPGSFYIAEHLNIDRVLTWSDFLYFSFVTLTTLGYGDIVPITSQARSISILEAVTGIILIAAMISGAIGIYISQRIMRLKQRLTVQDPLITRHIRKEP